MAGFLRHWMHRVRERRGWRGGRSRRQPCRNARMGAAHAVRPSCPPAPPATTRPCVHRPSAGVRRVCVGEGGGDTTFFPFPKTPDAHTPPPPLHPLSLPPPPSQEPIIVWSFIIGGIGLALPVVVPPLRDATAPGARAQPPPVRELVARAGGAQQ